MSATEVLIVDDDDDLRETLVQAMRDEGYQTVGAANGLEALDYLRQHPAPEVIFLDMMMPLMNGQEFREVQLQDGRLSSVPVVVMTASTRLQELVMKMHPSDTLPKPISLDDVLATVARYVRR